MKNLGLIVVSLVLSLVVCASPAAASASTKTKHSATRKSSAATPSTHKTAKTSTKKSTKTSAKRKGKASKKINPATARRMKRLSRAFVASADLKPMARQLLETRSKPAYAGVESYARRHAGTDAGALAWLVDGYARVLDKDYVKAVDPLKRAQPHAGDLGDYVAYFLATSYGARGQSDQVVATLRDFDTKYPESLFLRDAMQDYGMALIAESHPAEAARVLEKYRNPQRSDYEFALGRAYERLGDNAKAADAFKRVYISSPLSSEASDAKSALDRLTAEGTIPPPTFAERKSRADLLAQAHRYADAAREYRSLLNEASPQDHNVVTIALGVALHRSNNDREARSLLQDLPDSSDPSNALRLFALAEMARSAEDEATLTATIDRLRQTAPTSEYLEQSLLLGGNMYLLHKDYDHAIDYYRELQQRFPTSKRASYAHWKAAWLSLRQGRKDEAKKEFEEQVDWYPTGAEAPAALYWRARLAEEDGDMPKARAWYQKIADNFRNYYYAELARVRLHNIGDSAATLREAVLEKIPAPIAPAGYETIDAPADNLRVQKALLLQNGGMTEFAVKELRAAANEGGTSWASIQMARFYQENGRYDRALETLKRAVPTYYALDVEALPRPYWEGLFPRPYWTDLKKFALQNELDPFLVASLIRQESEFNPGAVSRADALGLMQLLPGTGKKVAHDLRVRRFSSDQLLTPNFNMQLGTKYFRTMVDQFGGCVEYALAAYNAGSDRVQNWLAEGKYRDTEEFVESIPFTETREYVQAIMRNAAIYKRLYGTP